MKIYTKTGDCGTTGLFAGPRVSKDHPRIVAYGTVDELNSVLGIVNACIIDAAGESVGPTAERTDKRAGLPPPSDQPWEEDMHKLLHGIQADLFSIGAELATPDPEVNGTCLLGEARVEFLEEQIDRFEQGLPQLRNFVLPGGSLSSAMLHWARTVCRRAERDVVHLAAQPAVHDCSRIVIYLNRLSDLLFVLAREANRASGVEDVPWTSH